MAVDPNIAQSGQVRLFIQDGGISPANPFNYYGSVEFGESSQPLGEREPIFLPSSSRRNKWDIVGSLVSPPELGSVDFTQRMDKFLRDVWWGLRKRQPCIVSVKAVLSDCARPDDQHNFDGVLIYRGVNMSDFTIPGFNTLNGENETLDLTGSLQFENVEPARRIKWGEVADTELLAEAIDGLYFDQVDCGDCGHISDGCQKAYVLTAANSGSPGLSSQILHTLTGWGTSQSLDINTLGGLAGNAIIGMGLYLIVVSEADGAHHAILVSNVDNNVQAFTRVATGYVGGASPRCAYAYSSGKALIGAQGGYIYKLENPTGAVVPVSDGSVSAQNVNAIDGYKDTIVAVGDSNAVQVSVNGGESFSLVVGPVPGVNLTSIEVLNNNLWFVGAGNGEVYFTVNQGDTWVLKVVSAGGFTTINDIWFVDEVVGYIAAQTLGTGVVFRTLDGGYSWQNTAPSISSLPTAERYRFVTACDYNTVMAGGRVSSGGDGILVTTE